jgi:hypothetical protein
MAKSHRVAYRLNFKIKNLNNANLRAGGSIPPFLLCTFREFTISHDNTTLQIIFTQSLSLNDKPGALIVGFHQGPPGRRGIG